MYTLYDKYDHSYYYWKFISLSTDDLDMADLPDLSLLFSPQDQQYKPEEQSGDASGQLGWYRYTTCIHCSWGCSY